MTKTEGLLGDAIAHHSAGLLDAAEHIYRALLEINADDDEARHYLGLLSLEKGLIDEGLTHLQRALELAPDTSRYWLGLAQGFLIAQRPEQAQIVLDRAEAIGLDRSSTRDLRDLIATALRGQERPDADTQGEMPPEPINGSDHTSLSGPIWATQQESLLVTMHDGLRIHVPSDIHCLTTYVLLEQGDWYDPGLAFLRRYIQPGMVVLDVGTGYGVYALSMAKQMQGQGRVVALEPASASRTLLHRSLQENALGSLIDVRSLGLSDKVGEVEIAVDAHGGAAGSRGKTVARESVQISSLDTLLADSQEFVGSKLDFLRLDIAVDAAAILRGGEAFFSVQNPLIMFGVAAGEALGQDLRDTYAALDMCLYRPIPSLGLLAPLDDNQGREDLSRELSLFACRDQTAMTLRQADLMI